MTSLLFQEMVKKLDEKVTKPTLLIVDGPACHSIDALTTSFITVRHLPPNTTSKLQPLDAGITAAFERRYRIRQSDYALESMEENRSPYAVDQYKAMCWVKAAWDEVSCVAIHNCWRHTGLLGLHSPLPGAF